MVSDFTGILVQELSRLHSELRHAVEDMSDEVVAWRPGSDMNSISTLVVHVLGSEAELLNLVAQLPAVRDRALEFSTPPKSSVDLLARIDQAERLLTELTPALGQADLNVQLVRPSAIRNREPQSALFWLLNGYGHVREHLAQIALTRQMHGVIHGSTQGAV